MQLRTLITLRRRATKTPERLPPDVRAREALKLVDSSGDRENADKRPTTRCTPSSSGATPTASRCWMSWQSTVKGLGLDIGANVGATLTQGGAAPVVRVYGVIAFEPNPANLPLLREAADDDVTIVERAASDVADQRVAFNLPTGTDQVCILRVAGVRRSPAGGPVLRCKNAGQSLRRHRLV